MSCGTSGCCLGLILGFIAAIVIAVAAAFGIYCYFTPSAREQGREIIKGKWEKVKSDGDRLIESVAPSGSGEPAPQQYSPSNPAPEPEI